MLLLRQRRYVLGQVWFKMLAKNPIQWRRNGVLPSQPSMPCSSTPAPTLPPPVKQSLLRRIFFSQKPKSRVPWFKWGLFTGVGSAMFGMYSVRKYRDSLIMDLNKPVHPGFESSICYDHNKCRLSIVLYWFTQSLVNNYSSQKNPELNQTEK